MTLMTSYDLKYIRVAQATVTNTVSPSGFGHVAIFERNARAVVVRAPPEILDSSDFEANTKCMVK